MSNGKLVILAGGISSRMKMPAVNNTPIDQKLLAEADEKSKSMIGVGKDNRPFLDYLLYNAKNSGYLDIVIVIGESDNSIRGYYGSSEKNNAFNGLNISYAIQPIPPGRNKPLGTADALLWGLKSKPEWKGTRFTVCNSDNLYSQKALHLMLSSPYIGAFIDYDRILHYPLVQPISVRPACRCHRHLLRILVMSKLSIRLKIISVLTFLVAALAVVGATAIGTMRGINSHTVEIAQSWLPSVRALGSVRADINEIRVVIRLHLMQETAENKQAAEKRMAGLLARVEKF